MADETACGGGRCVCYTVTKLASACRQGDLAAGFMRHPMATPPDKLTAFVVVAIVIMFAFVVGVAVLRIRDTPHIEIQPPVVMQPEPTP